MALLDDLSGFEFEDVMVDVFRNLGYEDVRRADRRADEGRDVTMTEVVDGQRRGVVVECKHTDTVGRPEVQKLHSAVATYDFDGPKRGIAATTGRFTEPAKSYVDELRERGDPYPIELFDGADLRDVADEVGLDVYNGRVEIVCRESLRPVDPAGSVYDPVVESLEDVEHLGPDDFHAPHTAVTFRPVVVAVVKSDRAFDELDGIVSRDDDRWHVVLSAGCDGTELVSDDVATLVAEHRDETVGIEDAAAPFDDAERHHFGGTASEYREWVADRLRAAGGAAGPAERASAAADPPSRAADSGGQDPRDDDTFGTADSTAPDVTVESIRPVYLPRVTKTAEVGEYAYETEYFAAGDARITIDDDFHQCVQCGYDGDDETYTHCPNCGSVNCSDHVKTERLEGDPVCTDCAVTGSFAFRRRYFYDEENREAFRERFESMPLHRRATENLPLLVGCLVAVIAVSFLVLAALSM